MALHRCSTFKCPFLGQITDKGCRCHQTDEQVLRDRLESAAGQLETGVDPLQVAQQLRAIGKVL